MKAQYWLDICYRIKRISSEVSKLCCSTDLRICSYSKLFPHDLNHLIHGLWFSLSKCFTSSVTTNIVVWIQERKPSSIWIQWRLNKQTNSQQQQNHTNHRNFRDINSQKTHDDGQNIMSSGNYSISWCGFPLEFKRVESMQIVMMKS